MVHHSRSHSSSSGRKSGCSHHPAPSPIVPPRHSHHRHHPTQGTIRYSENIDMADLCENEPVHDCDSSCEYGSDASEFRHLACPDFQIRRMTPACILSEAGIECIVWGCDALEFAHCIAPRTPYCHLLVEDRSLFESERIFELAEYLTGLDPEPLAFANFFADAQDAYPDSIHLHHRSPTKRWADPTPHWVLLTPMSNYHVGRSWCSDGSKTLTLAHPEVN